MRIHSDELRGQSARFWPRARHQGQAIPGGVEPFIEFSADGLSVGQSLRAGQQLAALLAVVHSGADQFNGLFAGHG